MSGAKDEGAAEKTKAQALSGLKNFSLTQAERAAVRNVNAYGQKGQGPSGWKERKEAKGEMNLMSTEKQVILGERKDLKSSTTAPALGADSQCQKCFQTEKMTTENKPVFIQRMRAEFDEEAPNKSNLKDGGSLEEVNEQFDAEVLDNSDQKVDGGWFEGSKEEQFDEEAPNNSDKRVSKKDGISEDEEEAIYLGEFVGVVDLWNDVDVRNFCLSQRRKFDQALASKKRQKTE